MATPYIGEIRLVGFNFAPIDWALCNGQLVAIVENEALFDLIGTTYGGDGQQTFALPNLQGRTPLHQGSDGYGNNYVIGYQGGVETVTLGVNQLPGHVHGLAVNNNLGTTGTPSGNYLAVAPLALGNVSSDAATNATMSSTALSQTGGSQPHNNRQHSLALNYIIALYGIFPSQ